MQKVKTAPYGWMFAGILVLSLALFGAGVYLAAKQHEWTLLAAGSLAVIGTLLAWPIAMSCGARALDNHLEARITPLLNKFDLVVTHLQLMGEQQLISDRAKQIAFREKDRDAFRRAVQEDLSKQDYDAALSLVDAMETEFGARGEVERIRKEVTSRRDESVRRQLDSALAVVDRHIEAEQWQAAFKEGERLKTIFPDQVRVQMLAGEIEHRRQAVKRQLLGRWQETVNHRQIDEAITVLRKLDNYLTPVEASGLEEDARMIFKEKLGKLRVEFTTAVQAHNWREAKRIADIVISDFPNTQMAREVRDMLPTLEERLRELASGMPAMSS
jgi:hypothetical protein